MPLIVISGYPSSGKTTRTQELKQFFEEQGKEVIVISESEQIAKAGFNKNEFYADSNKEKHIRGLLKSDVLKLITPNNIVILDALNYIKGYRYELFCAAKNNKCLQCTVHTQVNIDEAWSYNEQRPEESQKYDRATFDALIMRYEEPERRNRWDSPLYTVFPNEPLDHNGIFTDLFKKKPPKPNMSTQNAPLSSTNFLYDLDQITKKIADELVEAIKRGADGPVCISGHEDLSIDVSRMTIPQLMNLRRQYITYSKMNTPDPKNAPTLFVQYLSTYSK
ncbi:protein KTI12 homolog [Aethina tumida]|uniref:protein KTI12 homolog n=1 Tax=Aethina tumida TaxID=116153 RepID=UPI00096B3363|nr:protein KTI12 homolog [Aethina tumida]